MEHGIGPVTAGQLQGLRWPRDAAETSVRAGRQKGGGVGSSPHTDASIKEPVYLAISIVK